LSGAHWLTIWSKQTATKSMYMISTTGRRPVAAEPVPTPTNADSEIGVWKGRTFKRLCGYAEEQLRVAHAFDSFAGMAEPSRAIASKYDPYYLPEFNQKYLEYDPERANELLDRVGLKRGPRGMRQLPNGKPFRQIINVYATEGGTPTELWQLVADYFREVGLNFTVQVDAVLLSPMRVRNGNTDFWGYGTAGIHWVLNPVWYVPCQSSSYFAPLYGRYIASDGKDTMGVKPPKEYQRLYDWYQELLGATDEDKRLELGRNILRQWSEECYTIGVCRQELLTIVRNEFRNVPEHLIHDYRVFTPGYIGIEQFYIAQEAHETE